MKYHCGITCQIPLEAKDALTKLGWQLSLERGQRITFSDLLRESIEWYLREQDRTRTRRAILKDGAVVAN